MWDWSNSKKITSENASDKKTSEGMLDELFSIEDTKSPKTDKKPLKIDPPRFEMAKSDFKKDSLKEEIKHASFGITDFSLTKALKSGAKEDGLSKSISSIPPPPPSIKGATPFIRPSQNNQFINEDKKSISNVYVGAMGLKGAIPSSGDKVMWEMQLRQAGLPGMVLAEVSYAALDDVWRADLRKAYKRIRRDFLKYIGYHNLDDLTSAGIDEDGVKLLKIGRAPENFDVHIKVPLEYGGSNDFSNLCLIQTRPFHEAIHRFIDMQTANLHQGDILRSVFIPVPNGKVYVPEVEVTTGGGRQMADKSVYSGFLADTFKEIAVKSMIGKSRSLD